jgi:hypothetical protein
MDQRSICLFLAMKGLSAQAIYNELVAVLGPGAIGYSTATNYLRQCHFPSALRKAATNHCMESTGISLDHDTYEGAHL